MKNIKLVLFLIPLTLLFGCFYKSGSYPPPGRNTVELFGDGRFEIISSEVDKIRYYCLYDRGDNQQGQVEGNIIKYKEMSQYIYIIGTQGKGKTYYNNEISSEENVELYYTKVDYENGEIEQSTDLSSFSEQDIKIFNSLSNSESSLIDDD